MSISSCWRPFAAFLVLEDVLLLIWGTDPYLASEPLGLLGQTEIAGLPFDNYSLSMVLLSAVVAAALWYGLNRTMFGKLLLAVIYDRELAQAMGINVNRVFLLTFMLGSFLGALGGAYQAPAISVQPGIGVEVIVLAFAVVVIGGMGSIPGALIGSVIVGVARAFAVHQEPALELFVIYMIMAAVLIVRPQGLFAPRQGEKHMSWRRDKTLWGLTLGLAGLLLFNFVVPEWFRSILTLSLARGSVALGLLVLWRCGLISFGHALYFGFGAYTVGLMGRYLGITDAFLTIACGVATAGLFAYLLGFLLRQYRGIFFALLNMAFSMILYGVLAKLEELGSTDGISLEVTTYLWYAPLGAENKTALFIFAAILTWGVAVLVHLYLRSTLGNMTTAVRENEIRLGYLGYSGERAVHAKYVISGLVGGFGGAIAALTIGHVDPDSMAYWPVSGDFVFIAILSGTGNVVAPFIGALMYELIRTYAFDLFPGIWQLIMGGTLLAIIMFLPNGLWSLVDRRRSRAGARALPAEREEG
ncbi:High-affinity branched-chain amino acid transport system permease protein LivM [Geodia barretti]|uniref:High-affinity branched-chain amino acid transport system permease protein LivM n=1 Tax=Geodia barretti TaxID=519541 RepID=A0AA35XI07_GEOBA|nr:High-affinity branched-chain amino acid transport system permease protein LivM [Geodia barretti]